MNDVDTVIGRLNELRWMWNNGEPINGIILERIEETITALREQQERIAHLEMANRAAQGCVLCNFAERDACVEIRQKAERQRDAAIEALELIVNMPFPERSPPEVKLLDGIEAIKNVCRDELERIRGMK